MLRKYQEEIEKLKSLLEIRNLPLELVDLEQQEINENVPSSNIELDARRDQLIQNYESEMKKLKNLHENEKTEKENIMRQIEAIKEEYQRSIEKLNEEVNSHKTTTTKEEILRRIQELKAVMIGGERANDKELSEKRKKKKLASERRLSAIAHVLAKIEMNEDREILQNQYKDISYELSMKSDALRKYRQKVYNFF